MAGALIVTAEIAPRLFWTWLLKAAERNQLPAHLTMFHALPPSTEGEVRSTLARLASERPPGASIEGLMDLGGGVAFRIVSADLDRLRCELAEDFHGLLSAIRASGPGLQPIEKIERSQACITMVPPVGLEPTLP